MNRSSSTAHLQRRLTAILLITIAGIVIILTFTSQLEKKNNLLHNNHDDRRTRRRRLQGVMGDQGGGLLHHLDPKTVELKGQGTYSNNMVYIPPGNNGNGELTLRHPLLQLQQQQVQQIQQPPISPGFNNFNQQQQLQFQPQPLQQQQPVQQFAQPQIQQQEPITNNINTIVNTNNNNLPNPNNNFASNLIQVAPQNPQETAAAAAILPSATSNNNFPPSSPPLTIKPYNINNTLQALKAFRYQGFFFIYDSSANEFVIVHATPTCDLGCVRIYRIASIIAFALRKNFPERFPSLEDNDGTNGVNTGSTTGDLVFAISTGDVPRIHSYCLSPDTNYCSSPDFGPILQFGSVFVNTEYMPTMIAMPQPVRPHMPCFDEWQLLGQVCTGLQPAQVAPANDPSGDDGGEEFTGLQSFASGLVFGQELGLIAKPDYWNELIPQIIWRGTDFVFLHTMFPKMRRPDYQRDIYPKEWTRKGGENKRWAIDALWEMGEQLQPRWRGVLLTSEAELEAEEFREAGDATLPWLNIKFASCNFNRKKVDAGENPDFVKLQSVGIKAIGERVNMQEQAKYRYHIDLGGGKSFSSVFCLLVCV